MTPGVDPGVEIRDQVARGAPDLDVGGTTLVRGVDGEVAD